MLKSFILHQRPFAIFDPTNKEHRDLFYKYQKTKSWKHCPYQWTIDDDSVDLIHFLHKKLIDYYMAQEFKAKKPRAQPVLKIKDIKTRKKASN